MDGQSESWRHRLDGLSKSGRIFGNRPIPYRFDRPRILEPSIYISFWSPLDFGAVHFHLLRQFELFWGSSSFTFTPSTFIFGPCTFTLLGYQRSSKTSHFHPEAKNRKWFKIYLPWERRWQQEGVCVLDQDFLERPNRNMFEKWTYFLANHPIEILIFQFFLAKINS